MLMVCEMNLALPKGKKNHLNGSKLSNCLCDIKEKGTPLGIFVQDNF